ncbi:MAG: HD domain-containing phosphohydrolase [Myxococcota bacterium]
MSAPLLLVVEDCSLERHIVSDVALQAGYQVEQASNGAEALRSVAGATPNVILTDLYMPVMEGHELVTRLRRMPNCARVPILATTADSSRATRLDLLRAGADLVLPKPLDTEELELVLRALQKQTSSPSTPPAAEGVALAESELHVAELERVLDVLVGAVEGARVADEGWSGNQCRRVGRWAELLAVELGCEADYVRQVRCYAGLCDVGMALVPREVLRKCDPLDGAERAVIRAHTGLGASLLYRAGLPLIAQNMAQYHHERWDGGGYPTGRARDLIPLEGRILAVVDAFDALQCTRPFRMALPFEEARQHVLQGSGTLYDPRVVRCFRDSREALLRIGQAFPSERSTYEVVRGGAPRPA